jgi:hypothetical protein
MCSGSGKPQFTIGKIPPTAILVDQFFNDSTGTGDEGEKKLVPLAFSEVALPDGCTYHDKEGHPRAKIRAKWFGPRRNGHPITYRSLILPARDEVPECQVSAATLAALPHYGEEEPPVIFGHYWLPPVAPRCLARNAACVDHSIASSRGILTAYRWNGEAVLSDANFVIESRYSSSREFRRHQRLRKTTECLPIKWSILPSGAKTQIIGAQ